MVGLWKNMMSGTTYMGHVSCMIRLKKNQDILWKKIGAEYLLHEQHVCDLNKSELLSYINITVGTANARQSPAL